MKIDDPPPPKKKINADLVRISLSHTLHLTDYTLYCQNSNFESLNQYKLSEANRVCESLKYPQIHLAEVDGSCNQPQALI